MQKELRLTKREDFNKVYRFGKSMANHQFALYYMSQPKNSQFRLGISVSKKIGNAVVRNRLRRIVKEIVRLHAHNVKSQTDLILIARKPTAALPYADLEKSVLHVLTRAGIYKKTFTEHYKK